MLKKKNAYRVSGFSVMEVLITMILTSLVISMSYTALRQVQKLFSGYKQQNKFLQQYTSLKTRMDHESAKALLVCEESENKFRIQRDSGNVFMEINEKVILMKNQESCDTFYIAAKNITKEYEPMSNPLWINKLVCSLSFETSFTKQNFTFRFYKQHDAVVKLALNTNE